MCYLPAFFVLSRKGADDLYLMGDQKDFSCMAMCIDGKGAL